MKKLACIVFVLMGLCSMALADDDQTITADSTADQISAILDDRVPKIVHKFDDQHSGPLTNEFQSGMDTTGDAAELAERLEIISPKVLIDVLNQSPPYGQDFDSKLFVRRQVLYHALADSAHETDLPDLLASPAVEALWVICAHPDWCKRPEVFALLTSQMPDIPSVSPDELGPPWARTSFIQQGFSWGPARTRDWTLLYIADRGSDPAAQKLLIDTVRQAVASPSTSVFFLCDALNVMAGSKNKAFVSLAPKIMKRLSTIQDFPEDRIYYSVDGLLRNHPEMVEDGDFDTSGAAFIKSIPYYNDQYRNLILLARLGDAPSMLTIMNNYYNDDYSPFWSRTEQGKKMERRQFTQEVENGIIKKMDYHGADDRQQGIKLHYHSAQFQDGHWIVTDPAYAVTNDNFTPNLAASLPTPTPTPMPHSAAADKLNAAIDKAVATIPNPAAGPPSRVIIASRAPIETVDAKGQVTGVSMASVGIAYDVVRVDGDNYIVKDSSGTLYRIAAQAVHSAPAATANQ
ncbi:MAG: hypothetical protein LV479_11800 [Methylacidiphilales bacterium]|nr:hypothetical protein [Candidatus Methylacidiphilales bacterium]